MNPVDMTTVGHQQATNEEFFGQNVIVKKKKKPKPFNKCQKSKKYANHI